MNEKTAADRKKQALRDNLKRRKVQLREFGKDSDGGLSPRKSALQSRLARRADSGPVDDPADEPANENEKDGE